MLHFAENGLQLGIAFRLEFGRFVGVQLTGMIEFDNQVARRDPVAHLDFPGFDLAAFAGVAEFDGGRFGIFYGQRGLAERESRRSSQEKHQPCTACMRFLHSGQSLAGAGLLSNYDPEERVPGGAEVDRSIGPGDR